MAESVSKSVHLQIKGNKKTIMKYCWNVQNIIGESPQKIGITENNVNNIFFKIV